MRSTSLFALFLTLSMATPLLEPCQTFQGSMDIHGSRAVGTNWWMSGFSLTNLKTDWRPDTSHKSFYQSEWLQIVVKYSAKSVPETLAHGDPTSCCACQIKWGLPSSSCPASWWCLKPQNDVVLQNHNCGKIIQTHRGMYPTIRILPKHNQKMYLCSITTFLKKSMGIILTRAWLFPEYELRVQRLHSATGWWR